MSLRRALGGLALAGSLIAGGCGVNDLYGTRLLDSVTSNLQVCGFPAAQLDTSEMGPPRYLTSIGRLRLGQRLTMELRGDTGRVRSVEWQVVPGYRRSSHAAFQPAGQRSAVLTGVRLSADDNDFDFAVAHVLFRDGSEADLAVAVCTARTWQPANEIVVVP